MHPSPRVVDHGTTDHDTLSRSTCMCQEYRYVIDPMEEDLPEPPRMQFRLHRALRESFTSRKLPIPPLPTYRMLPRIAIQRDAPGPLWSCGTFAMFATLRLLLGGIPPHTLPREFITRIHMLPLHKALLEWLIQGSPPDLWQGGCLQRGIPPPLGTHTSP